MLLHEMNVAWAVSGAPYFTPVYAVHPHATRARAGYLECLPAATPISQVAALPYSRALHASGVGSMVAGYVLGLADRHQDNMLLLGGRVFAHIDFGYVRRPPRPAPAMRLTSRAPHQPGAHQPARARPAIRPRSFVAHARASACQALPDHQHQPAFAPQPCPCPCPCPCVHVLCAADGRWRAAGRGRLTQDPSRSPRSFARRAATAGMPSSTMLPTRA